MTVAEAVDRLPRRVASWAARRPLAINSMTGISLALGMCAAAWFTEGTRSGSLTGALALCGSYLVSRSVRGLGAPGDGASTSAAGISGIGAAAELAAAKAASDRRFARACAVLAECGICAGLAAGGSAAGRLVTAGGSVGRIGMWQLATTVVIVLAVGQLAAACGSRPPAGGERPASPPSVARQILAFPYGGRVLLIAVLAPAWGTRAALIGLLGWGVIAAGYAVASGRTDSTASAAVVACRDDGPVAKQLGLLVRGQLVPLPPALTGLAAVSVLAVLGMRNLPGFLLLAPVVAILLAAVGASHPHDGRLDWIVPAVLQAGQFAYIAAIGFASGVPAPLIFALCSLIALHYADLDGHAQQRAAMGWEGRMIAVGVGAALGVATFGYLLLAAYVVLLSCREIMISWPAATGGDRR
jgi:hypothetical protein